MISLNRSNIEFEGLGTNILCIISFLVMYQILSEPRLGISRRLKFIIYAVMYQVISMFFKVLRHHSISKERGFWRR